MMIMTPFAALSDYLYRDYVQAMLTYLTSFYDRTQPLSQLQKQLDKVKDEVAGQWESGEVLGWEDRGQGEQDREAAEQLGMDLEAFESVEELETLGKGARGMGGV